MNPAILNKNVQDFIAENINQDIVKISLSKSPFPEVSPKELATQIDSKRRSQSKLPLWYNSEGIYYPGKLAIEQCSSQATAQYKSSLTAGETLIDLTGGFGVDASLFALNGLKVTHCEINAELSDIAKHNSEKISLQLSFIKGDGIAYLKSGDHRFDTIYIDPSRRIGSKKVFLLKDCEPDVVENSKLLRQKASRIIIKTAPLLDLQSTIKEIGRAHV